MYQQKLDLLKCLTGLLASYWYDAMWEDEDVRNVSECEHVFVDEYVMVIVLPDKAINQVSILIYEMLKDEVSRVCTHCMLLDPRP